MLAVQGLFTKVMQAAAYTFGKLVGKNPAHLTTTVNYALNCVLVVIL